ncbi:JmjC domain, hydroxylase-domain-containing protein, partial [Catenaria anguillulae PL171]
LEPEYWRSIGILGTAAVPMYGADLQGTLWPSATSPSVWNTNKLDHILAHCLGAYARIPGVNSPFLYFGTWRATFGWHAEDMDLYSINYLHFGAPKAWYALSPSDADKFEAFAREKYPMDHKACSEFIRHKTFHFSPQVLRERGLEVHRMVQEKNEFVITFPRGYHAGFNLGFNCAESVNFALPRWFAIGKRARPCQCVE